MSLKCSYSKSIMQGHASLILKHQLIIKTVFFMCNTLSKCSSSYFHLTTQSIFCTEILKRSSLTPCTKSKPPIKPQPWWWECRQMRLTRTRGQQHLPEDLFHPINLLLCPVMNSPWIPLPASTNVNASWCCYLSVVLHYNKRKWYHWH